MKYFLSGEINHYPIKTRSFKTKQKAEETLSTILLQNNLQVESERTDANNVQEYVCNYHTRFFVGQLQ
jgi:hypothetical protein